MPPKILAAGQLPAMLRDGREIALLDLREEGDFTQGHLLLAASFPIGRFELDLLWRVPCRDTRIVLAGGGKARYGRALELLESAGYTNVFLLEASPSEYEGAGLGWFSGKYVPSKAFGEVVETARQTPHVGIKELLSLKGKGVHLLMVDSRTPEEFMDFALPGAVSCPGAELALRVPERIGPDSMVIVNCAGRTRSIIGAQSLINAGLECPVFAVENGTMGWHLEGHALQRGKLELLEAAPSPRSLARSSAAAMGLLQRTGGQLVSWGELQARLCDASTTTYFYDVRLQADYLQASYPGARSAPGGELVQSTDFFAPVRHARIVVADTDLVQAPMTAHWLRQMGWQADVLDPVTAPGLAAPAPSNRSWIKEPDDVAVMPAREVQKAMQDAPGMAVIDCSSSIAFRKAHIPGAWYCARASLPEGLKALPSGISVIVFTAHDAALARFAAADALALGWRALALEGGNAAWRTEGLPVESGAHRQLSPPNDVWYSPYEVEPHLQEKAMREYIDWEIGLAQRVAREPGVEFQVL